MLKDLGFLAAGTSVTGFVGLCLAIERSGKLYCSGVFANAFRAIKKIGMSNLTAFECPPQELFHSLLSYDLTPAHTSECVSDAKMQDSVC
jgi:hypothetical protein